MITWRACDRPRVDAKYSLDGEVVTVAAVWDAGLVCDGHRRIYRPDEFSAAVPLVECPGQQSLNLKVV